MIAVPEYAKAWPYATPDATWLLAGKRKVPVKPKDGPKATPDSTSEIEGSATVPGAPFVVSVVSTCDGSGKSGLWVPLTPPNWLPITRKEATPSTAKAGKSSVV